MTRRKVTAIFFFFFRTSVSYSHTSGKSIGLALLFGHSDFRHFGRTKLDWRFGRSVGTVAANTGMDLQVDTYVYHLVSTSLYLLTGFYLSVTAYRKCKIWIYFLLSAYRYLLPGIYLMIPTCIYLQGPTQKSNFLICVRGYVHTYAYIHTSIYTHTYIFVLVISRILCLNIIRYLFPFHYPLSPSFIPLSSSAF